MAAIINTVKKILMVLVLVFLIGCTYFLDNFPIQRTSKYKIEAVRPQLDIVITRDSASLPSGCNLEQVSTLVTGFFNTINSGHIDQIPLFFNLPQQEVSYPQAWYSITEASLNGNTQDHFVAYEQADLLEYFTTRHQQQEQMQLLMMDVNSPTWHGGLIFRLPYVVLRMIFRRVWRSFQPLRTVKVLSTVNKVKFLYGVW